MKSDGDLSGSLGTIEFLLAVSSDGTSGTYDLSWSGIGFPVTIDLVAVLKASNRYVAYLFDDELLSGPGSNFPGDSWTITFTNNGGQVPDLSHFDVFARGITTLEPPVPEPIPVPEPAAMLLFGTGLVVLLGARKRNKE